MAKLIPFPKIVIGFKVWVTDGESDWAAWNEVNEVSLTRLGGSHGGLGIKPWLTPSCHSDNSNSFHLLVVSAALVETEDDLGLWLIL